MEYDIFREELAIKYPAQGHALWIPSPGALYSAVEVGDVGFIRQGRFHRLFNVLLSADDPSHRNFGVPEYYEPLVLQMFDHIISATLSPKDFRSKEVTVVPGELGIFAAGPEPVQTTFSCSRKQGAILSLPVPTQSNDTLARGEFAKCILKYIDVWFAFARGLGLGVTRMEDIILVTGRDLARSWANVAFSKSNEGEQVTLGVQVSPGGGVEWQIPHEHVQGGVVNYGPSGQSWYWYQDGTKGGAVTKNSDVPVDTHTGKSLSDDEYDPDIISIRNELIRSRSGFSPSFSPPLLPAPSPPSPPHRLLRPYRSSSTPATAPVTSNPSRSALRYLSSPTAPPAGEPAAGMQAPPEPQPVAYSKPGLSKNTPCCDELEDHGGVPRGEGVTMCIPQWCCV
ncbi:hypothetical protein BJV78DRAFT_1363247 [Lactifluus subvellereus]|nr:hypothetical protein BJV78DRAFT_1363247 [Lactifluus subvellereus]